MKVGFVALFGGGEEGELRDTEDFSADVFDALFPLRAMLACRDLIARIATSLRSSLQNRNELGSSCDSHCSEFRVLRLEESHTLPPFSSSHSFMFKSLFADFSESLIVSSLLTAAKARMPLPIEAMSSPSTLTEADLTR